MTFFSVVDEKRLYWTEKQRLASSLITKTKQGGQLPPIKGTKKKLEAKDHLGSELPY